MPSESELSEQLDAAENAFHRNKFKLAKRLCEQVLRKQPEHPDTLHLLGLVRLRQGDLTVAEALLRRSIAADASKPAAHANLGIVLTAVGRHQEAIANYQTAAELDSNVVEVWNNLAASLRSEGRLNEAHDAIVRAIECEPRAAELRLNFGNLLLEQNRVDEAIAAFRKALKLNPEMEAAKLQLGTTLIDIGRVDESIPILQTATDQHADNAQFPYNLGLAFARSNRSPEAMTAYRKAIDRDPRYVRARESLGRLLERTGAVDEAIAECREWLKVDADNAIAQHMLAASSGTGVPQRASNEYVKSTFDEMAEHFDSSLAKLDYAGPQLVTDAVKDLNLAERSADILDAGCGTGLCGDHLRTYAKTLTGVDLSGDMLKHAQRRNVYDTLDECELTEFLNTHPLSADLIVAADTFIYFGDLTALFEAAYAALRPAGVLIFTLEHGSSDHDFNLCSHGRYSHSEAYLRSSLVAAELRAIGITSETLRIENGQPAIGLLVTARKPD